MQRTRLFYAYWHNKSVGAEDDLYPAIAAMSGTPRNRGYPVVPVLHALQHGDNMTTMTNTGFETVAGTITNETILRFITLFVPVPRECTGIRDIRYPTWQTIHRAL